MAWIVHVNDTSLSATHYAMGILSLAWLASESYLAYVFARYSKPTISQNRAGYFLALALFLAFATFVICILMSSK